MTEYIVEIETAADIERVVAATMERAAEEELTVVLDHQEEPCVVRGYSEPMVYDADAELEPVYQDGAVEEDGDVVRREDGGLSFYHNDTVCYMEAGPVEPGQSKSAARFQQDWADRVQELLAAVGEPDTRPEDADIYDSETGRQLAGTSVRAGDAVVRRACVYDSDPLRGEGGQAFAKLLREDGIDPEDYRDALETPDDSLLEHLEEDELDAERISAAAFIEPYADVVEERFRAVQERDGGGIRGSCLLSDYSCVL